MYEELIKRLREKAGAFYYDGRPDIACDYEQSADAIEELSAYVRQIEELRKDGYYLQKTKMMTYGQTIMIMPLPEPPKEET
jgi:hypothetical protein